MEYVAAANTVTSCAEIRGETSADNLSNLLTGLILNGFAGQNANGAAGLSTA